MSKWQTTKQAGIACGNCGKIDTCTVAPDSSNGFTGFKCWRDGGKVHQVNYADRPPQAVAATKPKTLGPIVAEYDYVDENGELLYQCTRHDPKTFRRRRFTAAGWHWNTDGVRLVPYRLPELLAADPAEPVYIAEGEKDVDNLRKLEIVSTCNCGGAGKWQADFGQYLAGRDVRIIADKDDAGRKHAQQVGAFLAGHARSIETLEVPAGKDASDFIAAGATADDFRALRPVHAVDVPAEQRDAPRHAPKSIRQLMTEHPELRPPVIHGILRQGETMNIIAPPKAGKSWLVTDLAISIASGRPWLDTFKVEQGNVLVIDNELHSETSAARIPKVAIARGVPFNEYADALHVENLRGRLRDLIGMAPYFNDIAPDTYRIIILDAFYRFIPSTESENDNAVMASMYNFLDQQAARLGCSFVCIHHSSKGSQSGKSVTDVGAGAGSQSRASDTHMVIRAHETEGAAVLDAAVRSWEPIKPLALRWTFPLWNPAPDLDPAQLASSRPRRQPREEKAKPPAKVEITPAEFAAAYLTSLPQTKDAIFLSAALAPDMSGRMLDRLLKGCVAQGLASETRSGPAKLYAASDRPAFPTPSNN